MSADPRQMVIDACLTNFATWLKKPHRWRWSVCFGLLDDEAIRQWRLDTESEAVKRNRNRVVGLCRGEKIGRIDTVCFVVGDNVLAVYREMQRQIVLYDVH